MSGKNEKAIRRTVNKHKQDIANQMIIELMGAPFKYRLKFALKLLRGKKGLNGR